eukprot:GEZU01029095.1.p1 GENE.GEZU01029095.1~~GEZU01029095.1.p1  ORF type:complete len:462 (-),score=150.03 GEZU01029095.1:81-1466(-)
MNNSTSVTIDRTKLRALLEQEQKKFADQHPKSRELFERARSHLLGGVPMAWMTRWAGGYPVFVREACKEGGGSHFIDVDGNKYLDLCLGDTGAMTGHVAAPVVEAVTAQAQRGFTFMLPSEDSIWVGEELTRRFGLPYWQLAMTATDANRFAIRLARQLTGRRKILVFNYCYHGTVDETFITLDPETKQPRPRAGNLGYSVSPTETTRVVEFNDVEALEEALSHGDVACVLAEPAMTNIGIIHPDPGFHDALRAITKRTGTLLIIDETHTISAGPGGYTAAYGLKPDILTLGKPIGGGVPCAVYGVSQEVADRIVNELGATTIDTSGIGGTLAGNAFALASMRATLEKVLTKEAYERTIPLADRFTKGVERVIAEFNLPWIVKQLGCRAEYWFRPTPPRNGGEAAAAVDDELDRYMHLFALNRGILMTPFHNMALIAPGTTEADIDEHTRVFREAVVSLLQ